MLGRVGEEMEYIHSLLGRGRSVCVKSAVSSGKIALELGDWVILVYKGD